MICYKNEEEGKINFVIPLHANIFFATNEATERDLFAGMLTLKIMNEVVDFIKRNGTKNNYYLDFDKVDMAESRVFHALSGFSNENHHLYAINIDGTVRKNMETETREKGIHIEVLENANNITERIKNEFKKNLLNSITTEEEGYYLESSNVYLNRYVNIKSLFNDPTAFKLMLYELSKMIIEKHYNGRNKEFDFLVSSSTNASGLVTCLAVIFEIPVIYFHNIGPKYALQNFSVKKYINAGKRYLHIYDFICMGTEHRLTKNIIESNDGIFVGGIGICSYTKPTKIIEGKEVEVLNIKSMFYSKDVIEGYRVDTEYTEKGGEKNV